MNIEKKIRLIGFVIILGGLFQIAVGILDEWSRHKNGYESLTFWIGVGFIASGIGIILRWHWSRLMLNLVAGFSILFNIYIYILWGTFLINIVDIIDFLFSLIFIWLINTAPIVEYLHAFNKYYYKIALGIFIVLVMGEIMKYGIMNWYLVGGDRFHGIKPFAYDLTKKDIKSNYIRTPFPFKYSIVLSEDFFVYEVNNEGSEGIHISLENSKRTCIKLHPAFGFRYLYKDSPTYLFEDADSYEFAKGHLAERYGILPLLYKHIYDCKYKIEQFQIGDIKGFKVFEFYEGKNFDSRIYFYKGNQIEGTIDIISQAGINEEQLNEIIASVQPNKLIFSEQQYLQEAKKLYEMHEYNRANFLFASALILNPWNAEAYYYLGSALFETGNVLGAMNVLEEALRQKKDYQEAKSLLDKIKQAEASKKRDQRRDKNLCPPCLLLRHPLFIYSPILYHF